MSLVERITQALNGTTPAPWEVAGETVFVEDLEVRPVWAGEWGAVADVPVKWFMSDVEDRERAERDARLIAEAPGLLAECAQRLTTDHDVTEMVEQVRFVAQWDASGLLTPAADLLEQVFLDPQETNQ